MNTECEQGGSHEITHLRMSPNGKALMKYNPHTDECKEWIKYPNAFWLSQNTGAIDVERDIIYIVNYHEIWHIDLKSSKIESINISHQNMDVSNDPTSIVIDHKLHTFSRFHNYGGGII